MKATFFTTETPFDKLRADGGKGEGLNLELLSNFYKSDVFTTEENEDTEKGQVWSKQRLL